ncbi:hypothetical protein V2J09_002501 [Rumex salicifolius]
MDLSSSAAVQHQQLHQDFSHQESESLESMIISSKSQEDSSNNNNNNNQQSDQKKLRPPETEPQQCPRCQSTNTKFCYYNNYSLSQPRYFCKACRRYWTKGGTLRNVPVGGGCRKSAKRASSNSPSQFLKRPHTSENFQTSPPSHNPFFSGLHGYTGGMMGSSNFFDYDSGVNNFMGQHHSTMSFMQDLQYGNGDGGFMFPSIPCNYDEIGAGNSNSGSGISDDVTALAPYGDVTHVKQETIENGAFWELPWQNSITGGEIEPIRENWNGLIGNYSVLGLLNSQSF